MILDQYEFRSCFSGYIRQLITQKHDEGFIYDSAKYILIRFDKFCLQNEIINPIITKELASAWGTIRATETRVTLGGRMSVLRQLSLYMCSLGINCYIPDRFSSKSYNVAYVMNEEDLVLIS